MSHGRAPRALAGAAERFAGGFVREGFFANQNYRAEILSIYPYRLRLMAAAAMSLFALSLLPDLFMAERVFKLLFPLKLIAVAVFGLYYFASLPGKSLKYYLSLNYLQVITGSVGVGAHIYLSGGPPATLVIGPALVILIATFMAPLHPVFVATFIGIGVLTYLIPTTFLYVSVPDKATLAYNIYFFLALVGVGISASVAQFRMTRNLADRMAEAREAGRIAEESEEQLKSQYQELELQRQRALTASRLQGEFLANISHELRTPLTGVIGFSGLLERAEHAGDEERHMAARIKSEGAKLLNLIDNLMDLSRFESAEINLRLEPISPAMIIYQVMDSLRAQVEQAGHSITVQCSQEMPETLMDHYRITQAVAQLVSNAIKFTPQGGHITVGCHELPDWVEIYVRDNGLGMTPEEMETIFDRFRQVDGSATRLHGGAGIGLPIVKSLVELHGGVIRVESDKGKGSTFTIALPKPGKMMEPRP